MATDAECRPIRQLHFMLAIADERQAAVDNESIVGLFAWQAMATYIKIIDNRRPLTDDTVGTAELQRLP